MIQKHRIATNIGRDQKVTVEINQNFDVMELLSLKFSQKDIYASGNCSEYGVVVGRVSANNGLGIPNAKVSIFVPQSDIDADDPVINSLYPYKQVTDKNENGYRYNLLPERQQHGGHAPTGTFPDQQDILTREEVLQVFESYYNYTVKTNSAGDFMIWGVPIGIQTLHIDIDLSDIGCFSLRPYDFIKKGYGVDDFERYYKFKSSSDIDGLPQIVIFDRSIEVYPLWGNEDLCEIGITRTDFDLSDKGIKIEPISLILLSTITDDNSDAVKRNGKIRKNTGYKCNLQTTSGKIECVRQTGNMVYGSDGVTRYPELEFFNVSEVIDEDGVTMAVLPMNMDYVYTNAYGEEEVTNDKNKGIPTTAIARFRLSLNFDSSKVTTAKYLVPNIREFNPSSSGVNNKYEYYESMISSYQFSDVFEDYITVSPPTVVPISSTGYGTTEKNHKKDLLLGTNNNGIPEDYFYKFIFGKVYTVSSFQGTHYETTRRDAFLGVKQIRPTADEDCASKTNYFPTNFGFKNRTKFSLLLSQVILFLQLVISSIVMKFAEIIGKFFYKISKAIYSIGIGRWRPFRKISQQCEDLAYKIQEKFTKHLPLTIYPDCEECTGDDTDLIQDLGFNNSYCRVAEVPLGIYVDSSSVYLFISSGIGGMLWYHNSNQTTYLPDMFPGETARSYDDECLLAPYLPFSGLSILHAETVTIPDDSDPNGSRYYGEFYGAQSGGTVSNIMNDFIGFFNSGGTTSMDTRFQTGSLPVEPSCYYVKYDFSNFDQLTGMDFTETPQPDYSGTYCVLRVYDRMYGSFTGQTGTTSLTIETGCEKYDKIYNEDIALGYIWYSGTTNDYGNVFLPKSPTGIPEQPDNVLSYADAPGYREFLPGTILPPYPYGSLLSTIIGGSSTFRMPRQKSFSRIGNVIYDRQTKSGYSEFRNGLFTLIPVINGKSYNLTALQEWYRRKRVGLSFCGGVVNYSFIDNWLNGVLYFFKFDKRLRWDNEGNWDLNQRGSKFPRELIFYHILDKTFYYRSCPFYGNEFVGQAWTHFDSNGNPEIVQEILHPTTFYDVGVRDEFLSEICVDTRIDPYCSVVRDITNTSYQDPANVVEYAINYRLDITNGKFDVDDFFSRNQLGSQIKVFDGDITQLMSINCEAGIEAFDLDSPHYTMFNGELMDPESISYASYFKSGSNFGPVPIDFKFDNNGSFIRGCLNYRLGDYSQKVPFYLWNKGGTGFGPYNNSTSDQQSWDKTSIASMKLQRLFSISGTTDTDTNYLMSNGEEEYLLKPMTINHNDFWFYGSYEDSLERFDVISYSAPTTYPGVAQSNGYIEGDLWLHVLSGSLKDPQSGILYVVVNKTWIQQVNNPISMYFNGVYETFLPQTVMNYRGEKQVLSTPFLFYFGLKPEKTALDILIKYFGPKGAFPTESIPCPNFGTTPTPSATPAASLIPSPTAPLPSDPWASPVVPTPTPLPITYYFRLGKCIDGSSNFYARSLFGGYISSGTGVWGGVECDPNYAYVVMGSTSVEADYISAGYTDIGYVSVSTHSACMDCVDTPITPPPTPPAYTQIMLSRKESQGDPAGWLCGQSFYNGDNLQTKYILSTPITPHTTYTVYNESNGTTPFDGGNKYWAIYYGGSPIVTHTVYVDSSGNLNTWTDCP